MEPRREISSKYDIAFEAAKWEKEIPFIKFPSNLNIKILPPFGGAIVRFAICSNNNPNKWISVYLDCYNMLGSYDGPYWEIYPYMGKTFRCKMDDTKTLLKVIKKSLKSYIKRKKI